MVRRDDVMPDQLPEKVPDPFGHSPGVDEDQGAPMRGDLRRHHGDDLVELFGRHHCTKLT